MIVKFSPQRSDNGLVVDRVPEGFIINRTLYDLSEVQDILQPIGPIQEGDSTFVVLVLPIGANAPNEVTFPADVEAAEFGPIPVPGQPRPVDDEGKPIPQSVEREPSSFVETGVQTDAEGNETPVLEEVQGVLKIIKVQNQPTTTPTTPKVVTMRQARLALLGAGKLQMVEAAIEALPEPPKTAAKIEWEYSQEVHRDKPFVQMLAQGLGLSQEELDQLFVVAATL